MNCRALPFLALYLGLTTGSAQTNPVKVAAVARFDLIGNAAFYRALWLK
jgi:hypothetical protein